MKKILVMAKSFGGGGSEVALIEFLNSLDLNKFSVTVLLLSKDNEYRYRLNKNIKIKYLNFDNPYYKFLYGDMYKRFTVGEYYSMDNIYIWLKTILLVHLWNIHMYNYGSLTLFCYCYVKLITIN